MKEETYQKIIEDYETQIDQLKKQVKELKELLEDKKADENPPVTGLENIEAPPKPILGL